MRFDVVPCAFLGRPCAAQADAPLLLFSFVFLAGALNDINSNIGMNICSLSCSFRKKKEKALQLLSIAPKVDVRTYAVVDGELGFHSLVGRYGAGWLKEEGRGRGRRSIIYIIVQEYEYIGLRRSHENRTPTRPPQIFSRKKSGKRKLIVGGYLYEQINKRQLVTTITPYSRSSGYSTINTTILFYVLSS